MLGRPSEPDRDTVDASLGAPPPAMPRWVKVFAAGVVALMLLLAVVLLVSGGGHGPARHGAGAIGGGDGSALSAGFEHQRR